MMSVGKVFRGLLSTTTIVQYEIDMPDLAPGDFGFALNTKTLFVGVKGKGNVKFYSNCLEEGVGGGSGGSGNPDDGEDIDPVYGSWTTNVAYGNIPAGTDLTGMTTMEILKMATVAYVNPKATVNFNPSNTLYEQGSDFNLTVTVSGLVKGTKAIKKMDLYRGGSLVQSVAYVTGQLTYAFNSIAVTADTSFEVRVCDEGGKYTSYSKSYTFVNAYYIGMLADMPTPENVVTLEKLVERKGNHSKTFYPNRQYVLIAYPASYGNLSEILDGNGFNNMTDFTKMTMTINGVNYNVYRTTGTKYIPTAGVTYKFNH